MKNEIYKSTEQTEASKEKKGNNVTIHAIFMRHGEKILSNESAETDLTDKGRLQAQKFGQSLQPTIAIKAYHSNTERTKNTAKEAINTANVPNKMHLREKNELGFNYDTRGNFAQNIFAKKKELLGTNPKNLSPEELHQKLQTYETYVANYYLSFGNSRPDPKTESPLELATKLAKRVKLYINMTGRLDANTDITLLNSTHDMGIHAFLKEMIGFSKIEDIGGPVDFTENFEIKIKTDEAGNKQAELIFRGKEYSINLEKLNQLLGL